MALPPHLGYCSACLLFVIRTIPIERIHHAFYSSEQWLGHRRIIYRVLGKLATHDLLTIHINAHMKFFHVLRLLTPCFCTFQFHCGIPPQRILLPLCCLRRYATFPLPGDDLLLSSRPKLFGKAYYNQVRPTRRVTSRQKRF